VSILNLSRDRGVHMSHNVCDRNARRIIKLRGNIGEIPARYDHVEVKRCQRS
jgi:hypothetical protein